MFEFVPCSESPRIMKFKKKGPSKRFVHLYNRVMFHVQARGRVAGTLGFIQFDLFTLSLQESPFGRNVLHSGNRT